MDLELYCLEKSGLIDRSLGNYVEKYENPLRELIQYCLLSGGKRFRPILVLATLESLGKDPLAGIPAACAIECVHAFSLVHDDMPCMDNDDFRRNMPTCHRKYGEGNALLAGDALIILAFQILADENTCSYDKSLAAIRELAMASGTQGMIGGQYLEMASQGPSLSEEDLTFIHHCKTAALIKAALRIGAILADASDRDIQALSDYGEAIGLLFQLVDDIIDSETKKESASFTTLLGREESIKRTRKLADSAGKALENFTGDKEIFTCIIEFLLNRKR